MANDVINSGDYTLVSNANYSDIFTENNASEAIFELDKNDIDNSGADALGGMCLGSGYGDYLPLYLFSFVPFFVKVQTSLVCRNSQINYRLPL